MAVLPTISTSCIVISALLVAYGWYLISRRRIEAHKKVMLTAAVFALLFFTIYMSRTLFIGNTSFGGPENVKVYYTLFLIFHIILATVGAVFGLVTIWTGLKDKRVRHRRLGPITSIIWFGSASTGVVVYWLLYVLYPGGQTTSLIKAVLGF
ncbi:DUF420 domain-containing protein [Geobacillus jurassicus]|uniref:DUF420 domain-containing protein n=1 Tax=Geobacillus jurassicus TaxID=235932 RepID=A0ABV6GSY6_9BACL|nr:DUF420 domain-containing protein [Geobacillus jurassicus]